MTARTTGTRYRAAPQRPRRAVVEDTLVSQTELDEAVRAIVRQVRVDRRYDIPYLAGSSRDGRTIYIDRHLPRTLAVRGTAIPIAPFLILHEAVEKLLFDRFTLTYPLAHQIALRLEQVAVRNAGLSWRAYNRFTQGYVKQVHEEHLQRLPADLEIKPYEDEHERALLARMLKATAPHSRGRGRGREARRSVR
jgi:hypothetical protein